MFPPPHLFVFSVFLSLQEFHTKKEITEWKENQEAREMILFPESYQDRTSWHGMSNLPNIHIQIMYGFYLDLAWIYLGIKSIPA